MKLNEKTIELIIETVLEHAGVEIKGRTPEHIEADMEGRILIPYVRNYDGCVADIQKVLEGDENRYKVEE